MELSWIKDYQALIGAAIVAIGWFVTGYLNRINNIALKRMDYRIKTFESFYPLFEEITNPRKTLDVEFMARYNQMVNDFIKFCYKDEQDSLDELTEALEKYSKIEELSDEDKKPVSEALKSFKKLVTNKIRAELKFPH